MLRPRRNDESEFNWSIVFKCNHVTLVSTNQGMYLCYPDRFLLRYIRTSPKTGVMGRIVLYGYEGGRWRKSSVLGLCKGVDVQALRETRESTSYSSLFSTCLLTVSRPRTMNEQIDSLKRSEKVLSSSNLYITTIFRLFRSYSQVPTKTTTTFVTKITNFILVPKTQLVPFSVGSVQ